MQVLPVNSGSPLRLRSLWRQAAVTSRGASVILNPLKTMVLILAFFAAVAILAP